MAITRASRLTTVPEPKPCWLCKGEGLKPSGSECPCIKVERAEHEFTRHPTEGNRTKVHEARATLRDELRRSNLEWSRSQSRLPPGTH